MKRSLRSILLLAAILLTIPTGLAQAQTGPSILQHYAAEQTAVLILSAELQPDELTCTVSNRTAEILAAGALSDDAVLVKTTVLVDASASMPSAVRNGVLVTLSKLIESKPSNEEFRIITFSETLNTLQDFSVDRYDLAGAVEKITFTGKQSMIYDAVYNTIPPISLMEQRPTFYRTIVVTDGVDDTASGITKEELFIRLQNEPYPVDVIAVSKDETAENKELAAIVRMSGGRYFPLISGTDTTALAQSLGTMGYFYVAAKVPTALLDGTTRQVDISDGATQVSADVKFPTFNLTGRTAPPHASEEPPASASVAPEFTESAGVTLAPRPSSAETDTSKPPSRVFGVFGPIVLISTVLLLLVGAAVIITAVRARGKKRTATALPETIGPIEPVGRSNAMQTEFVNETIAAASQYIIKLSAPSEPNKSWVLPIANGLFIGRAEHCAIRLEDASVSREQCKLVAHGSGVAVVHMGSTNKTVLNGGAVMGSSFITAGDMLKFGRAILRVDYIQTLGAPPPRPEELRIQGSGKTESIF